MIQTLKNVKEYKEELIRPAIREMLNALDISKDLKPGMKVAIKPNLVMANETGGSSGDNASSGSESCGRVASGAGN